MGGGFRPLLSEAGVRDRGRVTTRSRAGHGLAHTRAGPAHGAAPRASARRSAPGGPRQQPGASLQAPRLQVRPAQGSDFRPSATAPGPGIFRVELPLRARREVLLARPSGDGRSDWLSAKAAPCCTLLHLIASPLEGPHPGSGAASRFASLQVGCAALGSFGPLVLRWDRLPGGSLR